MGDAFETRDFNLEPWQLDAVEAWVTGAGREPFTGTLEIFTGGGKTLIALACAARAAALCNQIRLLIVVPTESLLYQWSEKVLAHTSLTVDEIGMLGAGANDSPRDKRCLICVLPSAAKRLPAMALDAEQTILVVDECHRAGAPTFSRVLDTPAKYRLGLSATPDREEVDEDGMPIEYDEQLVGKSLGGVIFRFSLREARKIGWLPEYKLHHHGVQLLSSERTTYDDQTRRIDDLADRLAEHGLEPGRARQASSRNDSAGATARAYVAATAARKDLLYRAIERRRVASSLVLDSLNRRPGARILLFHERVDEATSLYDALRQAGLQVGIVLEHSRMTSGERRLSIDAFRRGEASILVSVKSLVEGLDVPEADVGILVASSASVRQRVQSLGRVLRRSFSLGTKKEAEMHLLYISNSVDELIYAKEDWSDLTGEGANTYWIWTSDDGTAPIRVEAPPRTPVPTEDQEWLRLGGTVSAKPRPWKGVLPWSEYSVDVRGNVINPFARPVANPQGVDRMVLAVRGRPGGRFFVTPMHRLVVVRDNQGKAMLAGQLSEPFAIRELNLDRETSLDIKTQVIGERYNGPADKLNGTFKIGQKRGGVIERRNPDRSTEFAFTTGTSDPSLEQNAIRILEAWRSIGTAGMPFYLNHLWHAWYEEAGEPRFLGVAERGFRWPSDPEKQEPPRERQEG